MRKTNNIQTTVIRIVLIVSCAILVLIYNNSQAANGSRFTKTHISFKQLSNNDISLKLKSSVATQIQFYLFTADGKLVKKIEASNSSESVIKNPGMGIYLYQCFEKDKALKSGKLILEKNKLNYD